MDPGSPEGMEIVKEGAKEVYDMESLNCCWPPGTMNAQNPEDDGDE